MAVHPVVAVVASLRKHILCTLSGECHWQLEHLMNSRVALEMWMTRCMLSGPSWVKIHGVGLRALPTAALKVREWGGQIPSPREQGPMFPGFSI
jgi:hypothetical protein